MDNDNLLKEAQDALRLSAVYLRGTELVINEAYDPILEPHPYEHRTQSYRYVTNYSEYELSNGETEDITWEYKFIFETGVRLVPPDHPDGGDEDESTSNVLVELSAKFEVRYLSPSKVSEDAIKIFYENNVGFNAWPFWREFVFSTCSRIGMVPPISVPFYKLNIAHED